MPEGPEVEFAARSLRAWTAGRGLARVEADPAARRLFRPGTPTALARAVEGARFGAIRRVGKQLLVALEREGAKVGLLVHLGMTGKWLRRGPAEAPPRFSRVRLHLDDGAVLHFSDLRLFGRVRVVPGARFEEVPEVAALGRDPIDEGIDVDRLAEALGSSRLPVKVRIMDQAILPGVGNIYASEACFRARIDPRRLGASLDRKEVRALAQAVVAVLRASVAREEGPEIAYVEEPGTENPFAVYGKEGARCPRCKAAEVRRVVQAQRSTFFCPACQG